MSNQILFYMMGISAGLFVLIAVGYFVVRKQLNKGDAKRIRELRAGTKKDTMSAEVVYQKLYNIYKKVPALNRYVLKIRRKLEIIHMQDEYKTRMKTSQIISKVLAIVIPLTFAIVLMTKNDILLMVILLFFEVFLVETLMTGMVDKLDTKLLKQQIDFFAEIRHAYHEFNMVEEAIYEVSQNDELEVSIQGQRIYEILISDDPETELEKYYDVAPNSYLKEFAGVSYLTREFGDRTVDGASLYLKNLNNITQEMQLEILKRDKLDYVFQSLSVIAMVPILGLTPLRAWAVNNFSFTKQFYDGKLGLIIEILLVLLTFICYVLVRKIKDTGSVKDEYKDQNKAWQMKLYNQPTIKKFVDLFIPKKRTKEYRTTIKLLKEAASKQKIEALYVTRMVFFVAVFLVSILFFNFTHKVALDYIYEEPTADYNLLSDLSPTEEAKAMELTEQDNEILEKLKDDRTMTEEKVASYLPKTKYYVNSSDVEITQAAERIYGKLVVVQKENFKWFELLLAFMFGIAGYSAPMWILMFQKKLRSLEMENEVMEYQTIITMLMKIERVNVEIILEWIERYANIFKEPITKCVNNYEAGAWEALEELKNDIAFQQLIRLVESLQAAVEKIPISEAFDELDNERDYYQAKREESNEKLIKRKAMIGKVVGFAPMVALFVGYLIGPLIIIGMTSMTSSFSTMSTSL